MSYKENRDRQIQRLIEVFPDFNGYIVTPEEYDAKKIAINQSGLKVFMKDGPEEFKRVFIDSDKIKSGKDYFIIGTLMELILTGNTDKIESDYKIIDEASIMRPSADTLMDKFCKLIAKGKPFVEAYAEAEFKQQKIESVINTYNTLGYSEYVSLLMETKTIINKQLFDCATTAASKILTNPSLTQYTNDSDKDKIVIDDLCIIDGDFKCRIDRLIVNVDNKEVTIVDFKTTGKSLVSFADSVKEYGYDKQMCFYSFIVSRFVHSITTHNIKKVLIATGTKYTGSSAFTFKDETLNEAASWLTDAIPLMHSAIRANDFTSEFILSLNEGLREI